MLFYKFFTKLFQVRMFQNQNFLKLSLLSLTGCFLIALTSFCFFSSGLNEDGSYDLFHLLMLDKLRMHEIPRTFFHFIYTLPIITLLSLFPASSFSFLTQTYSFSLIYIHILTFLFCFWFLPKDKKNFIFFPLFSFLTGHFILLNISVSVAFSLSSYLWIVSFIIYYIDLSKRSHKALFLIAPIPLLLSHEMISYFSWFLIFLTLFKLQSSSQKNQVFEKSFIPLFICFLIMVSFLGFYFILNPQEKNNLIQFQDSLFSFKFLFDGSSFNLCLFMALFLKLSLFLELFWKSFYFQILLILLSVLSFFIFLFAPFSVFQETFFTNDYISRVYPPVISVPFCFLMWWLAEQKGVKLERLSKSFLWACCLIGLSFTVYRIKSDLEFDKYRKNFSRQIGHCEGLVSLSHFKKKFPKLKSNSHWKITAESLILPQRRTIKAVLFNDFCEENCKKHRVKLNEDCSSFCKILDFDFPNIFSDPSLKEHSFFNFQPLIKNWELQKNFCQ